MLGTARLTGQTLGAALTAILFDLFATRGETIALEAAAGFALVAAAVSAMRLRRDAAHEGASGHRPAAEPAGPFRDPDRQARGGSGAGAAAPPST
jgi:hypothetical protein